MGMERLVSSNPKENLQNEKQGLTKEERRKMAKQIGCNTGNMDYFIMITEITQKMPNQKLLKRVYDLAEYLYVYEYEGSV